MSQDQTGNHYINQFSHPEASRDGIYHYHSLLGSLYAMHRGCLSVLQLNVVAVQSYQRCFSCVELVHKQIVSAHFSACYFPCMSCQLCDLFALKRMGKKMWERTQENPPWKKEEHVFSTGPIPCPFITETMGKARSHVLNADAKAYWVQDE